MQSLLTAATILALAALAKDHVNPSLTLWATSPLVEAGE